MNHRFFKDIRLLQNQGINQFFLYGSGISDVFYNAFFGSVDISTTLAIQLLYHQDKKFISDFVLVWEKKAVTVYERGIEPKNILQKRKLSNQQLREKFLGVSEEKENALSNYDIESNSPEKPIKTLENIEENTPYNTLILIMEILNTCEKRLGLVIENITWIAHLFEGRDHRIQYLEKIEEIREVSKKHVSFIIIDNLEIISNYLEMLKDKDNKSSIYIGSPSIEEITLAYTRGENYQRLTRPHFVKVATIVKNSGKHNLRSAINILVNIKNDLKESFYHPKKIIQEFEKVLASPLENITWKQLHIDAATKLRIQETIKSFFEGTNKKKGILLYGPPGTGKTMIAKIIAHEAGLAFYAPKLADLKGEFLGHSGRNIKNLFVEARSSRSLIFIDEADGVFQTLGNDAYSQEITKQFLPEVDGVDTGKQGIFLVMATNHVNAIDEAVKSRFELIEIPLPSGKNRRKIFQALLDLSSLPENHKSSTLDRLTKVSEGFSGRDVKGICGDIEQKLGRNVSLDVAIRESFLSVKNDLLGRLGQHEIIPYFSNEDFRIENVVCTNTRNELEKFVTTYPKNLDLVKNGLRAWNGIFLLGREGNGQRFISKVLANVLEHDLVVVSGLRAANVSEIFQQIVKISLFNGVVLFFEGMNAIIQSGQYMYFVNWLKKIREESYPVVFIVALQNPGAMDDFEKKFDICIKLDDPNQEEKKMLIQRFFEHPFLTFAIDFPLEMVVDYIDQKYSRPSISEIKTFCDEVKRNAFLDQSKNTTIQITEKYF